MGKQICWWRACFATAQHGRGLAKSKFRDYSKHVAAPCNWSSDTWRSSQTAHPCIAYSKFAPASLGAHQPAYTNDISSKPRGPQAVSNAEQGGSTSKGEWELRKELRIEDARKLPEATLQ